jgi:RNA polymerase sigma-70 factor (ECF subfamily)
LRKTGLSTRRFNSNFDETLVTSTLLPVLSHRLFHYGAVTLIRVGRYGHVIAGGQLSTIEERGYCALVRRLASNMAMAADDRRASADESFVRLLTAEQFKLLRYIAILLGDPEAASNVLQDTNLVLWRKAAEFKEGTNFSAWARQVAYWEVRAYVRNEKRDRHVFSEEVIEQLAEQAVEEPFDAEVRVSLRHCLQGISSSNLQLLQKRYAEGLSIAALADECGKTDSAIKVGLMRLRRALLKCIRQRIASFQ